MVISRKMTQKSLIRGLCGKSLQVSLRGTAGDVAISQIQMRLLRFARNDVKIRDLILITREVDFSNLCSRIKESLSGLSNRPKSDTIEQRTALGVGRKAESNM